MFDSTHPDWREFKERVEERIAELQAELERPLDLDETNRHRGAIGELRRFVADGARIEASAPPNYTS